MEVVLSLIKEGESPLGNSAGEDMPALPQISSIIVIYSLNSVGSLDIFSFFSSWATFESILWATGSRVP